MTTLVHKRLSRPHRGACLFIHEYFCCGGVFDLFFSLFRHLLFFHVCHGPLILWLVWIMVWVNDRFLINPLFVRFIITLFSSFSISERWGWSRGASKLNNFYLLVGCFVSVCCPVVVIICVIRVVYTCFQPRTICRFVRCEWSVPCIFYVGEGVDFLPFLTCFPLYFPQIIPLLFRLRLKAVVGCFRNSCCILLLFMRSHSAVRAFFKCCR